MFRTSSRQACDKLLAARVDSRVSGKKIEGVMNRLQVFHPVPRDNVTRDVCIPEIVMQAQKEGRLGSADHKPKRSTTGYAPTKEMIEWRRGMMEA